ncbi:efflux RND transporter periplasmic adaptor subunit [Alteromonadales] [Pseudoalteromonas sp. PS1M3]|jgi:Cu(I)/Ag(I) efflux system membrane fusion protein|uniref:efflux RND transporter periplasmic adaptor subunit n=1 Tax=Alteromonadales TaxID=135622 RepID=UPI0002319EC3|nr:MULTISPECIES: efflux RND transporter periplasmic adaptor subunit [Alteromonadales]MBL1386340.1 efflux RND transporter periplasmic adaptor subunit [Colwellia sp.]TMS80777.1 efflux RND transporter periplasmic adaptor subunit [Pseudoalteromonas sp. S554]TMS92652.1 efflux RND transporter periplasmic adaptor subunit [Pseudoalteromonas sp. S201]BBW91404.1 efflux RND transporter periplasmic adaptor subunit [Alteromonadales] [Pseudoalteromonas sp. PS1M3]GAA74812.1 Cu(I)/Ag(I) efflux system membrane|tara:strand:- start:3291 stop:5105 length:1815 start_codon:yes stop_codon:yes gene_type:complete
MNNNIKPIVIGMVIGGFLTFGVYSFMAPTNSGEASSVVTAEKKPLYWVAPMDANYKRDKPGKSPMGMDLVPVYDDGGKGPDEGPGTIRISPDVVNNLGVRTAIVSYKSLHTEINTVGYVAYDEDKLVHIHPRVQGWIEKLYVKAIGDPVKKGQPLYEIYSPELVNAQEELLLALDRKNSRLISAAENRLSALQLPKSSIVKLKKTKKVQQTITFYSPQNGVVENLKIREGFFVKPGSTLMSIGDLSEVWVEAEVFERQAGQVKTGTPVTMTLDYLPGKTWQGKVDYIYPTLDAKTRTVKVRLRFKNEEGEFKPNMFAQIAIHTTGDEQALLIPKEALIRTGNQDRVVLALGEGSFKSVAVSVGRYDSESVEILEGVRDGEKVVSSAQFLLDSESSKSSDFKRMNSDVDEADASMPSSVWVQASIESMMADHKMLTLAHEAIPEWEWPEMTMDFIASDSVDFSLLSEGMSLHVEVTKEDNGDYKISNIHVPDDMSESDTSQVTEEVADDSSATVTGTINSLMIDHGMVNISRTAIEKWGRPAATLDFITGHNVSLEGLSEGMEVKFTFEVRGEHFVIFEIAPLGQGDEQGETSRLEAPVVDHSNH